MAADADTKIDLSLLKDLTPVAQRLNDETDAFRHALETIEQRLNDLNLGVEVWLDQILHHTARLTHAGVTDGDTRHERLWTYQKFGYGRLGDGWALQVRTLQCLQEYDRREQDWISLYEPTERERKALVRSSRQVRVIAVGMLPELIEHLRFEATHVLEAVEQAKKLAESLK